MKITLIGDGGTGKTTALKYFLSNVLEEKYEPTIGVEVVEHSTFNFWDCAGIENNGGLRDGYYIGSDVFIIFCSCSDKNSIKNIHRWRRDALRATDNPNIKIFYVFNKYSREYLSPSQFSFKKNNLENKENVVKVYKMEGLKNAKEIFEDIVTNLFFVKNEFGLFTDLESL